MTEVERIINKGILPKGFLKEEIRCDFFVDEKRKKLWAVEIDLLVEFDRVCKKHDLKYFLTGGSLLGAVRHNGSIPWDDDIDVAMFRSDYEKLMALSDEFKYPYFLQTPYTDKGYYFSYAKIRNSKTTGLSIPFAYQGINQGIPIDIFPLDNCMVEDVEERYNKINYLILQNSICMRLSCPNPNDIDKKRIATYNGRNPMEMYEEMQQIAKQYENCQCDKINTAVCTAYKPQKLMWDKKDWEETIMCKYENYMFPIPKGYDNILKVQFGDYTKYPPAEERGQWHNNAIFDADIAYTDYIKTFLEESKQK